LLTVGFIFAALYLIRRWADNQVPSVGPGAATVDTLTPSNLVRIAQAIARTLPSQKTLDRWSYRFVALGFPVWTFGVICGAVWAEHAWGRYWGWDPKETFAFITWTIFAVYLHARVTHGWREVRAAAIACVGFVSVLFTLYAVNLWIAGLHSYAKA
jgi:cytochrome c-type biogenesis protein CcsB